MKRRKLVTVLGTAAIAGCAEIESTVQGFASNPYIDEIKWVNLNELEIYFQSDHNSDGFAILHQDNENPTDYAIVYGSSPQFVGPIRIPLIDIIEDSETVYPSTDFHIKLYEGSFCEWKQRFCITIYEEELGSYNFTIPRELMPPKNLAD